MPVALHRRDPVDRLAADQLTSAKNSSLISDHNSAVISSSAPRSVEV
ncbi:hypothetical protein [Nocardia anaemiae]|nr:hypothetical protein [Nocardia anaemiae]